MLVERDGVPDYAKVLDFGIAKVPVEEAEGQKLTQNGTISARRSTCRPSKGRANGRVARDLYALGVILYEMLAGKLPFFGDEMVVIITRHILEAPPPLPDGIHPGVKDLVFELLEKDPAHRIQSATSSSSASTGCSEIPPSLPWAPCRRPRFLRDTGQPRARPDGAGIPTRWIAAESPASARASRAPQSTARLNRIHRTLLRPVRIGRQELPRYALLGAVCLALLPPLVFLLSKGDGPKTAM